MDWAEDIVERLASFADEQRLVDQAEKGWRAWFVNEGGTIEGWRADDLNSKFRSLMLCFKSALLPYPYITTSVGLFGPNGGDIGQYRRITLLNGDVNDDYLEIDCTKSKYQERHARTRQRRA